MQPETAARLAKQLMMCTGAAATSSRGARPRGQLLTRIPVGAAPMSNVHVFAASNHSLIYPTICRIGVHDVRDALREGFGDFLNNPSHLVFLGFIYPTVLLSRILDVTSAAR